MPLKYREDAAAYSEYCGGRIRSRNDLFGFWNYDARAKGVEWTPRRAVSPISRDRTLLFQRRLRRIEYWLNVQPGHPVVRRIVMSALWRLHLRHAERLGLEIPPNVFGPAMDVVGGTIVVSETAQVGFGARLNPGSSITATENGAPAVGDNLELGLGARLIGPITLGHDVTVHANAVVSESFGDGAILPGSPARQINVSA